MTLKELRKSYNITQAEAALSVDVPLRTYVRFEAREDTKNLKHQKIVELLKEKYEMSETNGIYTISSLKSIISSVIVKHQDEIKFCYLFGSYAKNYAKETSDVDICVDTTLKGLDFVGFVEELRVELKKEVDVIRFSDLKDNMELLNEIMKDGIKIYG